MRYLMFALLIFGNLSAQSLLQLRHDSGKLTPNTMQQEEMRVQAAVQAPDDKKSTTLAVLYSVLLPGMGELYLGNYNSGKLFTMADAALWITYFGMDYYSKYQKDNFKTFAAVNGGVKPGVYSDAYYADLGNYMGITEYNDEKSFQRQFTEMYDANLQVWQWDSQTERREYRRIWLSSQQSKINLRFVVGALVLNRAVSAINAVRIQIARNKKAAQQTSMQIGFSPDFSPKGGMVANLAVQF